jgi:hypothetical protein
MTDIEGSTAENSTAAPDSKALRLVRYLREFVGLRSATVRDVAQYDSILWFGDIPQESECTSPAWRDGFEQGDPWLSVRKQQFPKAPAPPEIVLPWIDEVALSRASTEQLSLREKILTRDPEAQGSDEPPLVEWHLSDHPEVEDAFERYRPQWEAWSKEYLRRARIQAVYAELFRLHTQVRKEGEIVELVLGIGLLAWRSSDTEKSVPILRHVVTARVELNFEAATGLIRLYPAAEGAQLRIEDDMLEAERRPQPGNYDVVNKQLKTVGDEIWDRSTVFSALRSWAESLHPDTEWSPNLKPATGNSERPTVTFAPALILRKRNQIGMVRVYEALAKRLRNNPDEVPPGWQALLEDQDDRGDEGEGDKKGDGEGEGGGQRVPPLSEVYFPLRANRQQRQIVEAINTRRGVLVQGPPGTGKSHTIANLTCHLLATGKRVLITAETARALQVLKEKLPKDIQPLCVSLLGQGTDAFAELNSAVQGITSRYANWSAGAHSERIKEIDGELDISRRVLSKTDNELRSLRQDETIRHSLLNGRYQGTASAIGERVARERDRFEWLKISQDAGDESPLSGNQLMDWLRIRRSYSDEEVRDSNLKLIASDQLPAPSTFATTVALERDAKAAVDRLAQVRRHSAYLPVLAIAVADRARLTATLRQINVVRKQLERSGAPWLSQAVVSAIEGRRSLWQELLAESSRLVEEIDQLWDRIRSVSMSIPADRDIRILRADVAAISEHLRSGGKWTAWGLLTPRVVKDRAYIREQITIDGRPPETIEDLDLVCRKADLSIAIEDLERAWLDFGGLPAASHLKLRVLAIKEHLNMLATGLNFAEACSDLARLMSAATRSIPEPDWLSAEVETWLEVMDAADVEEHQRQATEQVTSSLRGLIAVGSSHDAHPVLAQLRGAIETRDAVAYGAAYERAVKIEKMIRDQALRLRVETVLASVVPGLQREIENDLEDGAWDTRLSRWEEAWSWAVVDNWLSKRTNFEYQKKLLDRRRDAEETIGALLAEGAALHAWTYFFERLQPKQAAALRGWREAVKAIGKGTGRSARIERLRREARLYMDQCREAIPVWIMPRYLVAEMIDPAPGKYDLVIVDEASQLGIESLFLFYVAKKMVVVGDDQVSAYQTTRLQVFNVTISTGSRTK